ncbi:MAG TPA: LptF/LptG family permease [Armatimonadota bacterium]|nr:LptF/LptG family permease [Armatimonadota bacterium]
MPSAGEPGDGVRGPASASPELNGNGTASRDLSEAKPARAPRRTFGVMDVVWFLPRMVMRLFLPKLIDRYVMGELLTPLAFGWTLFICLFVFSLNLFKLASLAARGAPLDAVGEMLWLRVVLASVYCIPMAMLLAGLLAFGRLSGDSELIATQAGGIPNLRIVVNAFILGLLLSFVGLAMNEYVIPPAGKRLHATEERVKVEMKAKLANMLQDLTDQKAFVIQDYDGGRLSRIVIAKRFEEEEKGRPAMLRDVTYMAYDKGRVQMVVEAERAEWVRPDEEAPGKHLWRFINANTQLMMRVTPGQRLVTQSESMEFTMNKSPRQVARDQKDADQMTYGELDAYIRDLKRNNLRGRVIKELEVEKERKLAVPFSALVLALVGAPLGIRKQRSTTGVGIGLSLLIIIFYYIGMSALGVLGQNGQIEAKEAAWGCNVAGLLVGLFLTWRSSR